MTGRRVLVFGPAYLDRILRVDRPLVAGDQGPPIDQSVEGAWKFGESEAIEVIDPEGFSLEITPPPGWPGPRGEIRLQGPIREGGTGRRRLRALAWSDDLGGMGAGYASALDGVLHSALGPSDDPTSRAIAGLISRYRIEHRPLRVPGRPADWTLLITSGEFGDKLPIGFRGCHAALDPNELAGRSGEACDVLVVAALPNPHAEAVLRSSPAPTRFFAPALRNMSDRRDPVARFADRIHLLSCNRMEWETLEDREAVASGVPIVAVTDGSRGVEIRFMDPTGQSRRIRRDAFPRSRPPRDTNRAGEAFASTFLATLLDDGWTGASGEVDEAQVGQAADRAAAAAAIELDLTEFGFPGGDEVEAAIRAGRVD